MYILWFIFKAAPILFQSPKWLQLIRFTETVNKTFFLGHRSKRPLKCVHLHNSSHKSADMQLEAVNYESDQCPFLFVGFKQNG